MLDRVFLDRQISRHEDDELVAVAESIGLSREDAIALHRLYLTSLAHSAQSDGMVVLPSNGFDGGHPATLQKCRQPGLTRDGHQDTVHSAPRDRGHQGRGCHRLQGVQVGIAR